MKNIFIFFFYVPKSLYNYCYDETIVTFRVEKTIHDYSVNIRITGRGRAIDVYRTGISYTKFDHSLCPLWMYLHTHVHVYLHKIHIVLHNNWYTYIYIFVQSWRVLVRVFDI